MRKFIYAIVLLISSLIIIYTTSMSDLECSILMCSNFIIILLLLWATSKVSPALLFFTTFSFLFIGGRFWALILGFDGELWSGTFFDTTFFSSEEKKDTMAYILLFSYLMFIGYNYSYKLNYSHDNYTIEIISRERLNFFFSCALFIIVPVTLFSTAKALLSVMSNGYLALYVSGQNGEYASGSALFDTLQFVLFGLVMTLGSKKNKIRYFVIYLITAFVGVIMGGRGAFGALLMFCIWQLSTRYTFNIKKLLLISSFAVVLLLFVFSFSVRSVDSGNNYESFFELFSNFIYSQGISMAVFNQSRDLTYPILPYIQTFVPGSSTLYSFISGVDLHPYDVSFSQYLSWYLNPTLFYNGNGLGWTLLGDLYLISGKTWGGYALLSLLFGFGIGYLENKSKNVYIYNVILYAIFFRLMMLPRASLSTIIPMIIYTVIFYYLIHGFLKTKFLLAK